MRSFDSFNEQERQSALEKQAIVQHYFSSGKSVDVFLREAQPDIKRSTLYGWIQSYKTGGLSALCPRYSERGKEGVLSEEQKTLIKALYLRIQKPSLQTVLEDIKKQYGYEIAYSTAQRYIKSLPVTEVTLLREGGKKYRDKCESYVERDYTRLLSMEWVCADHKTFDFLVVDSAGGKPYRPIVTAFMDLRSRKIIGWCVAKTPCRLTVASAMEMAFMNWGIPRHLLIDNGADFKSITMTGKKTEGRVVNRFGMSETEAIEMKGILEEAGVTVHFCEAYRGQSKPIERFFRTQIEKFEKKFDTYVGSNTVDKPEAVKQFYGRFGGEKLEVKVTLEEVKRLYASWVCSFNATHRHTGNGMEGRTPDSVFELCWAVKVEITEMIRKLLFSDRKICTVQRRGVSFDGIDYWAEELPALIGKKVKVRRPLSDFGIAWIYSSDDRYLCCAVSQLKDQGYEHSALQIKEFKRQRKKALEQVANDVGSVRIAQAAIGSLTDFITERSEAPINEPEVVIKKLAVGCELLEFSEKARDAKRAVKKEDRFKTPW